MLFEFLVGVTTLVTALYVFVWWRRPDFRQWIEAPKYRFMDQQRRFDNANGYPWEAEEEIYGWENPDLLTENQVS